MRKVFSKQVYLTLGELTICYFPVWQMAQESDNSCFLLHFLCIHFLLSHIASVCFMIVYLDKTPHLSSTTYLFLCPTALLMLGPVMFMGAIRDTYVCRSGNVREFITLLGQLDQSGIEDSEYMLLNSVSWVAILRSFLQTFSRSCH